MSNKNIKYLSTRERARYYRIVKIPKDQITDADVNDIAELEVKAERLAERDKSVSLKRIWEG